MYYNEKPVYVTTHAVKQARKRHIAFPDQVYTTVQTGNVRKFGRRNVKFIGKRIICIGEDVGHAIVIKTVERK
ncbi:MAG: hypothetical protein OXR66_06480 [Candidatus Woesearchaeota archaeon]|nr:hypothetical protein [Candidatus Woesearchaeota archaeon]